MRILQVRFKNLNSLVGEWQIDLMHPAFASDGIFAPPARGRPPSSMLFASPFTGGRRA